MEPRLLANYPDLFFNLAAVMTSVGFVVWAVRKLKEWKRLPTDEISVALLVLTFAVVFAIYGLDSALAEIRAIQTGS